MNKLSYKHKIFLGLVAFLISIFLYVVTGINTYGKGFFESWYPLFLSTMMNSLSYIFYCITKIFKKMPKSAKFCFYYFILLSVVGTLGILIYWVIFNVF